VTAAAFTYPVQSVALVERAPSAHPVPRGATSDPSDKTLKRAAVASLSLHILLAVIAALIHYWPSTALVGTPQDQIIDVTLIPLSALETVLPKGAPAQQPVDTTPEEQQKPHVKKVAERQRTISAKKIVPAKSVVSIQSNSATSAPSEERSEASSDSETSSSEQPIGVANGEALSPEQARLNYQDMVATLLARAKRYPERALKRGMTGVGMIRIEIQADGSLSAFQIVQSTETSILDEELRAMVERASPFPAFPADLRKSSLALVVPVAFRLQS
jgi:protein TonB